MSDGETGLRREEEKDVPELIDLAANAQILSDIGLRETAAKYFLFLFGFSVIATFALIFLWAFKMVTLPDTFIPWLGGATIGEIAGIMLIIVKSLFPSKPQ